MTLKIHVILHHYKYYFETTGQTFKFTNGEFTESCHSSLRKSETTHGLRIVKKLGTPIHQQRSLQSLTFFNSKRAGFSSPILLRKKSSFSPSTSSSTISSSSSPTTTSSSPFSAPVASSSSPFTKRFLERYPEALWNHYQNSK